MVQAFLITAAEYLREFAEVAILGFFLAGVINAVVNKQVVASHLRGSVMAANALAATWGFLTPLCCCSGIPTALTLYRSGSRRGPACAFLIAVPWFNWYGLTALTVFLGWRAGLLVSLSAVVVGFIAGVMIDVFGIRAAASDGANEAGWDGSGDGACCDAACSGAERTGAIRAGETSAGANATPAPSPARPLLDFSHPKEKVRAAWTFALDLVKELGPWMLAGVALGALAEVLIPKELVSAYLGKASVLGLMAAVATAMVFYTDSLATLPWVRTLLDKGLGLGSGMVLLVAGVGTNVSTLGPIARVMGTRTAMIYGGSVVTLTALLGFLLNRLL